MYFTIFLIKLSSDARKHRLENDQMCGLTTGGSEECWWTCDVRYLEDGEVLGQLKYYPYHPLILNPSCLSGCYPENHCLSSLLDDYEAAGGICPGSNLDKTFPGMFQVSNKSCGCSERTQELLRDRWNCIYPLKSQKDSIFDTAYRLVWGRY